MRLNRVPTSVKLATELMKSQNFTPSGSPSVSSSVIDSPQPHPTAPSHAAKREMPHNTAMLPPPTPHPPSAMDLGKGRPTLSVPSTPGATSGPLLATPASIAQGRNSASRSSTPATSQIVSRMRPSLPTDPEASGNFLSVGARHNRYRTSMHESTSQPMVLDDLTKSPPQWTPPNVASATLGRSSSPYGLGLDLPSSKLLQPPAAVGGSMTPAGGLPSGRSRLRSTTDKTLRQHDHAEPAGETAAMETEFCWEHCEAPAGTS
jgi:hypothetical protein